MLDQDLSGLTSLLEFHGKGLLCSWSPHEEICEFLLGPVAEALWAMAVGWPQLLDFEPTDCAINSYLGAGEIQTTANSLLRWGVRHANAAGLIEL